MERKHREESRASSQLMREHKSPPRRENMRYYDGFMGTGSPSRSPRNDQRQYNSPSYNRNLSSKYYQDE